MKNTFGNAVSLTIFGESHGPAVGAVLDGLAAVGTDEVFLEVQSSLKPGIFKAAEPENFLYLVMPVRIA